MSKKFADKVALVSGAASGIGQATALAYAAEGAKVVAVDLNAEAGNKTVEQIKESGGEAVFIKTNVAKDADVAAMVAGAVSAYGKIDFAINNAGLLGPYEKLEDWDEKAFDLIMNVNVKGVWLALKHQLPVMTGQGFGSIVNLASVAGILGMPRGSVYSASKHAVIGLTKSAALENAKRGIRVNAVCPSIIETPMVGPMAHGDPVMYEKMKAAQPMKRYGKPEEVAAAILWLSSGEASYVNGHSLVVDGGMTIM